VPYTVGASMNHIWRPLVEKAGYSMEDLPKTWDAYYDFFKDVQKKLRAQGMRHVYERAHSPRSRDSGTRRRGRNRDRARTRRPGRTFRMLARRCDTPAVQLVERPQIAMAGPLGIYSSGAERVIDPLQYRAISVIALNYRFDVGYARLPASW